MREIGKKQILSDVMVGVRNETEEGLMRSPRDIREAVALRIEPDDADMAKEMVSAAMHHYMEGHWQEAQAAALTAMALLQFEEMRA